MRNAIIAAILTMMSTTAWSQDADSPPRYALAPIEGGILRLDTITGEVSRCAGEGEQMICRLLPDERTAYVDAIDALEARVKTLEDQVAQLQDPTANLRPRKPAIDPADEAELEQAFDMMQKMMRRFFDMVREFKDEMNSSSL